MVIPLGGDAYVNPAHISLISGLQTSPNRRDAWQIRLVLMGNQEHVVIGDEESMRKLHQRQRNALDELGP